MFLLTVLAFSTGLGWNPGGLGAAGDLLPAWLVRFGPATRSVASPIALLTVYESFALSFGLGGLVWAVRHGHRFGILLGVWAGAGILLLALMPGRTPLDILWVLLPLALLGGVAVERLAQGLRERGEWLGEGLHAPVVVILWVHCYLVLARYAVSGDPADLALLLLTVVLQGLLAAMFALAVRMDSALRAVAVGSGVVLLATTLSAAWSVAYVRPADPRELMTCDPTAIEVRDLVQTLRDLSWRETGLPSTLSFTLEAAPDSVLAWYLRDFSAVRRVEDLGVGMEGVGPVLVTERPDLRGLALVDAPGGVEYVGQSFALHRSWEPVEIGCTWEWPPRCRAAVKWLLFRATFSPSVVDRHVVLWLDRNVMGE